MRTSIFRAVVGATAAGVIAALAWSGPGVAATEAAPDEVYVTELGVEGDTYPDGWFLGTNPDAAAPGSFTDDGLVLTGRSILLHGGVIEDADLTSLVESAAVDAEGDWTFQIPVFLDAGNESDLQFTTFRPVDRNVVSTEGQWRSSRSVAGLTANTPVDFDEVVAAFESGADPQVLAYGVIVEDGATTTVSRILWDGVASIFTPEPPAPAEPVEFTDVAGITFAPQIAWLAGQGITTGYPDGTFRPSEPVLREQVAAFLYRFVHGGENPSVSDPLSTFADVVPGHVFSRHIAWLADEGITTGYTGNAFRPGQPVLREQVAAFLYRMAESPAVELPDVSPFKDVPTSHVFYRAMVWMDAQGITTGYTDGTFRPGEPVLREQLAAFLHRVAHQPA